MSPPPPAAAANGRQRAQRALRRGGLAATAVVCAMVLTGCTDIHQDSCVWHSDLNIKGCAYFGYRSCIESCTYCITENGPDECGQLKCAASCAKQDGNSDCLSNYKALCDIALEEQDSLSSCDVDCSRAPRSAAAPGLLALLAPVAGVLFVASGGGAGGADRASGPRVSTLLLIGGLVAMTVGLQGCCTDPDKQLDWEPDLGLLKDRADWFDADSGTWRGVPSWQFSPHHEAEEYECKQVHATRGICVVWTAAEWNCDEEAFGMCQCYELAPVEDGDYCQAWGCHALEASQEVCTVDSEGNSDSCHYSYFPMDAETYQYLMQRNSEGMLTTGENTWFGSSWFDTGGGEWPPSQAYSPTMRTNTFLWNEVCIVNGDNKQIARRRCSSFREIETEISHCYCKRGSQSACLAWHCEERDVGLFSALFRTRQNIDNYTIGTELEEYECIQQSGGTDSECIAWEGHITSPEEVEVTRCQCTGRSCHAIGATWTCDEYDLPRTRDLFFPKYQAEKWPLFILPECFILFMVCMMGKDGEPGLIIAATAFSCCCGVLIMPFLIVTLGAPGFLLLGGPFWVLRCLCCACGCIMKGDRPGLNILPGSMVGKSYQ